MQRTGQPVELRKHPTVNVQCDREGNLYSMDGKPRKSCCNGAGYLRFSYRNAGSRKTHTETVHRTVALCWVDGYQEGYTVNHKDGNKHNNHADNLEWLTAGENTRHAYATGLNKGYVREQRHRDALARIAATHKRGPQGWCIA